ncbi:hypothetical protein vBPMCPL1_0037 [Proteus phage vB_PMC-PL1]|nr:hypothetical protein [Proteus phage VTCCBPA139]
MKELTLIEAMFLLAKQECSDEAKILLAGIDAYMNEDDARTAYQVVAKEYEDILSDFFNNGKPNVSTYPKEAYLAWNNICMLQKARDLIIAEV